MVTIPVTITPVQMVPALPEAIRLRQAVVLRPEAVAAEVAVAVGAACQDHPGKREF